MTGHDQSSHRNGYEDMVAETAWLAAKGLVYRGTGRIEFKSNSVT